MTKETELEFTQPMMDLYSRMLLELGHNATVLLRMVTDEGGYRAAKSLVCASRPSKRFMDLKRLKRLDLSVEAWILRSDYHRAFSLDVKGRAYLRLFELGFKFPADSWDPKRKDMWVPFNPGIAA